MADDVARRTALGAVGTQRQKQWEAVGRKQFKYLRSHGLERNHQLIDIGCGNLRAGRHLIHYLDAGHYTGVDISPEIVRSTAISPRRCRRNCEISGIYSGR